MPNSSMAPPFMNQSNQGQYLSASSLSGPPVSSQPPTLDVGGRQAQAPGQYQPRQQFPGQGLNRIMCNDVMKDSLLTFDI